MNFLFLNSARSWGGNEHWMVTTAEILQQKGHEVSLAYRKDIIGDRFGGSKYKLPFITELDVLTILKIKNILRKCRIDVVFPTKQKDYALAGAAAAGTEVINILRLGIVRNLRNSFSKRHVYDRWCDGIIVNAAAIRDALLASPFIVEEKIRVIYNSVNTELIKEKSHQFDWSKPADIMISTSSMLVKRKRIDLICRAFAGLLKDPDKKETRLLIIGGGPEMDTLQQLCSELKIAANVIFTGHLENPFPFLVKSDLFIMTSANEGISNSLLEAMALSVPVITSPSGGVSEIIENGKNGIILDTDTPGGIAEIMTRLLDDAAKRKHMGVESIRTIQQKFSADRMCHEIETFCRQRIAEKKDQSDASS